VDALAVYNGDLIAGGGFTTAGGMSANRIARWDGSTWHPLGSGISREGVAALTLHDGQLVAGGGFFTVDGEVSAAWARWGPVCPPGDVDQDGIVGFDDFKALLNAWGPCPDPQEPCPADFDGDGMVGVVDFLILLANWG
jgi:hypothetical protein